MFLLLLIGLSIYTLYLYQKKMDIDATPHIATVKHTPETSVSTRGDTPFFPTEPEVFNNPNDIVIQPTEPDLFEEDVYFMPSGITPPPAEFLPPQLPIIEGEEEFHDPMYDVHDEIIEIVNDSYNGEEIYIEEPYMDNDSVQINFDEIGEPVIYDNFDTHVFLGE
jgi:hypothetical protein